MNHGASSFRRRAGALFAGVLVVGSVVGVGIARADDTDVNDPSFWPGPTTEVNPSIETNAHALRYFGEVRDNTNLSMALGMAGDHSYPFNDPNRNNQGVSDLNHTDAWWGARSCPNGIIVTTRDRFSDSLDAAPLSEPGNAHSGPTAANLAEPDHPIDSDIDMDSAPVIITASTREGATSLSAEAQRAAQYLQSDNRRNCGEQPAENAVIVGGSDAVPTQVEGQLTTIGYDNVYRIAGIDRNDTAKKVGLALGTGGAAPDVDGVCTDTDARDGVASSFYDNAAPEFWTDETHCAVLPQTVILADGGTGADPLTVGVFASFYGIPILLTNADGSISDFTKEGLQTLDIQNLIVAGGTTRIPDASKDQAAGFAGITADHVFRIAGDNRQLTSIEFAKHMGGWFPQGDTTFASDMFCVAASSGEGLNSLGWPDSLGAGPLCSNLGGVGNNPGAPSRLLPPANGSNPIVTPDNTPSHYFVPLFLTPAGGDLDGDVSNFLAEAFPETPTGGEVWCDSNAVGGKERFGASGVETAGHLSVSVELDVGCADPGFGIALGGTNRISENAFKQMATRASGGKYTTFGDLTPVVDAPFFTKLDLDDIYANGSGSTQRICANRGAITDVQFLAVYDDAELNKINNSYDIANSGQYDASGVSKPVCVGFEPDTTTDGLSHFFGDSLSGHFTAPWLVDYNEENSIVMSQGLAGDESSSSGTAATLDGVPEEGQTTTETHALTGAGTTNIAGTTCTNLTPSSTVTVIITRGADDANDPDTFTATFTLNTSCGTYTGTAIGEAQFDGTDWSLQGVSTITGGTGSPAITGAVGGFTFNLLTGGTPANTDDTSTGFQFDGILP